MKKNKCRLSKIRKSSISFFILIAMMLGNLIEANAQEKKLQKGFYLDKQGNKVNGMFSIADVFKNVVKFISDAEDSKTQYLFPREVNRIVLDNGIDILVKSVEDEMFFIGPILKGVFTLYEGRVSKNQLFYLSTPEQPESALINRHATKTFLSVYFKNCPIAINKVAYTRSKLMEVLNKLHECQYPGENLVKFPMGAPPKLPIMIGIRPFYSQVINQNVEGWHSADYHNMASLGIGINFRINPTKKLSFDIGFQYLDKSIETPLFEKEIEAVVFSSNALFRYQTPFKLIRKHIQIPVGVNFNLSNTGKFKPYLQVGAAIGIPLKFEVVEDLSTPFEAESDLSFITADDGPVITLFGYQKKGLNTVIFVGAGANIGINSSSSFDFGIRYSLEKESFVGILSLDDTVIRDKLTAHRLEIFGIYFFQIRK